MTWIFKLPADTMMQACQRMRMPAIEGVGSSKEVVEKAHKHGLTVSNAGSTSFKNAPLNRDHHDGYVAAMCKSIDNCSTLGVPNIIAFTGYREKGITDQQAKRNCIEAWQKIRPMRQRRR